MNTKSPCGTEVITQSTILVPKDRYTVPRVPTAGACGCAVRTATVHHPTRTPHHRSTSGHLRHRQTLAVSGDPPRAERRRRRVRRGRVCGPTARPAEMGQGRPPCRHRPRIAPASRRRWGGRASGRRHQAGTGRRWRARKMCRPGERAEAVACSHRHQSHAVRPLARGAARCRRHRWTWWGPRLHRVPCR